MRADDDEIGTPLARLLEDRVLGIAFNHSRRHREVGRLLSDLLDRGVDDSG